MTHVQKRKIVYGAYRDLLRGYHERANDILDAKPAHQLSEDRGVADRLDRIILQQQNAAAAPPPPPPPPPQPGQAVGRLKTVIPPTPAEPPACVQNAMMTKDKKPFTYTPGGLDLSQIRSPRMARRLTRNANSEGVDAQPPPQPPPQPMPMQSIPQPPPPLQPVIPAAQPPRPQLVIPPPAAPGKPAQVGSLYVPPLDSPVTLNRAPTPWLTRSPPQAEPQPAWVTAREQPQATPSPQPTPSPQTPQTPQYRPVPAPQPQPPRPAVQQPATRVIPVQIQMTAQPTPPPYVQQTPPVYMQQAPPGYAQPMPQVYMQSPAQQPAGHAPVTRIIPIQLETDSSDGAPPGFHSVQSPAFRVLQKMTSRDDPADQVRRMQLSDDDRLLMNRLRAQVDEDSFLHDEVDPRYRGAAIPSRAFRILQSMTDGDGTTVEQQAQPARRVPPRAGPPTPASEQPAPQEPRKYTGGAIPSRSFQMLQAMVSPDACAQGGTDTDTESSESYHVDPWYYTPVPPNLYWHDPYWQYQQYYLPPSQPDGTAPAPTEGYAGYYPYDYGYYPYPYPYGYDAYLQYDPSSVPPESSGDNVTSATEPESEPEARGLGLQAIRSVTDIHRVYDTDTDHDDDEVAPDAPPTPATVTECEDDEDDDTEEEDDDDEDDEEDARETGESSDHVPHQLSVIFEESDIGASDRERKRENSVASEDDSSTTIAVESGDEEETVTVRLPLRFQFSRSENDEDVTTVIVGDSQMDRSNSVSVTVSIPSPGLRASSEPTSESEEQSASVTVTLGDQPRITRPEDEGEVEIEAEIEDEEEADSGVTSQTDTESECFPEVRRLTKYQRAATHSRLYKLLHGECDEREGAEVEDDDDDEDVDDEEDDEEEEAAQRRATRQQLSLPLTTYSRSSVPDSVTSSGIASPASTPPRRARSAACSEPTTPGEPWSDYGSYYSSWECGATPTPLNRSSPFPRHAARCPMTSGGCQMSVGGGTS